MSVRYYDSAGWSHTLSQACSPIGDAQCDGTDFEDGEHCDCTCHLWDSGSIRTTKQVKRMHELGWLMVGKPTLGLPQAVYYHPQEER